MSVEECPLITFRAPPDWSALDLALERLASYRAVAMTSPRAATALTDRIALRGLSVWPRQNPPSLWAGGAATAAALGNVLGPVRVPAEATRGEAGAAAALARPCSRPGLQARCSLRAVTPIEASCRIGCARQPSRWMKWSATNRCSRMSRRRGAAGARATLLVVASPTIAQLLIRSCSPESRPRMIAAGPTTAASAQASGWTPAAVAGNSDDRRRWRQRSGRFWPPVILMNDLFLRACRREPVERPPVWMMRQAGRYLPQYRAVRERADFLTMVGTPELAVEVTLQPVDLLGVDAAIIFSDILVVPQAMGMTLTVEEGIGPRFHHPLRAPADFDRSARRRRPRRGSDYVLDAMRLARRELAGRVPLIGFAGAPWTLMSYMVEGAGSKSFSLVKRLLVEDPAAGHTGSCPELADIVGRFLVAQVRPAPRRCNSSIPGRGRWGPGIFESSSCRTSLERRAWPGRAGAPVIVFAPGSGWALEEIAGRRRPTSSASTGRPTPPRPGGGYRPPRWRCKGIWIPAGCTPRLVRSGSERGACWMTFGGTGHIANLGHGILPDVPVSHAQAFVDAVREWRRP